MKEERIAEVTDIEAIIIECSNPHCKSQVKIPIGATIGDPVHTDIKGLLKCPVCTKDLDKTLVDYVKRLKDTLKDKPNRGVGMETIWLSLKCAEE